MSNGLTVRLPSAASVSERMTLFLQTGQTSIDFAKLQEARGVLEAEIRINMKIAILGGAGAMGMVMGARLGLAGQDVTLVDVFQQAIDTINTQGLIVDDKQTGERIVMKAVKATSDPGSAGVQDLVMVFVKCYHTESAIQQAAPMIGSDTTVMTIQNGWGNGPRIASIVGEDKVVIGLTYHSATALGPGHALHTGKGVSHVGELNGQITPRLQAIAAVFNAAGLVTETTEHVLLEIYMKLALNCCTLPTSALLRFEAHLLVAHDGTLDMMRGILREVVAVANAQGIALDYLERWNAITTLLKKAMGGKSSMLQDVEKRRQTEIDVINGAIVAAGRKLGIPTPYNESMVWLVKALEETFGRDM